LQSTAPSIPGSAAGRPAGVDHYENFPVASWLCPPRLRPAIQAIYWFARTADDIADEGDAPANERQRDLAAYRAELLAVAAGASANGPWRGVFDPLGRAISEHRLPLAPLLALLDAFEEDTRHAGYDDRAHVLAYCERSANPIGRLLLHLHGLHSKSMARRSDAVCTALQLVNFWQDLSLDVPRGRLYIPREDAARHGLTPSAGMACPHAPAARALVAEMVDWARELMREGAPLALEVPGRIGWELRLVVQGGLRILEKIEAMDCASFACRPRLRAPDHLLVGWRALAMRGIRP
jgi:squalene synthase HpnC